MRMISPTRIKPGAVALVVNRPESCPFRADKIEIDGDPSRWCVHDIKIGNRSQGAKNAFQPPVLGNRFCESALTLELRIEPCQTAMDFVILVEYVGPLAEGEVFMADVTGIAVL
jgi:hypothetical protein